MSKAGDEEDEDNECFYESLDRILSSTASSCSSSHSSSAAPSDDDEEGEGGKDPNYSSGYNALTRRVRIPRFPMGVTTNYDVWISQPSSVEERRMRLLRQMGLSCDPSLSRQKPSLPSPVMFGKSVSADHLNGGGQLSSIPVIVRSKSADHDPCSSNSLEILSLDSASATVTLAVPAVNNHDQIVLVKSGSGSGSSAGHSSSPSKPPTGKNTRRQEEIKSDPSGQLNSHVDYVCGELGEDFDCIRVSQERDPVCTIRNLDNGKEFVVDEIREDGTLEKVKEVGTGRHLTVEEFEMCVGHSPIVQELMRRQNVETGNKDTLVSNANGSSGSGSKTKKKGSWFRSVRNVASSVAGHKERRSSDDRDTSSERGGRRSSSATDDSQDVSFHGPERVRVRQYGTSCKDLTALYKSQEIRAHNGSIWTIKFSLDGKYLASAGEDCVIHVWQVLCSERKGELLLDKKDEGNLNVLFLANGSPEPTSLSPNLDNYPEKKRRGRLSVSRKLASLDHVVVPETMFELSEKAFCSFQGHLDDVLDLSWSKSHHLLSSSMDKTVRLWQLSTKSCLKTFSHSDYVTCIQFNPVDDRYFISGSLDAKVRIWSIPDRQVVDWNDLHEMVTAACYTPDGQAALVGSCKGSCRLYNTAENKLLQKSPVNLQNKKKKSHHKKITGFQFAPGNTSEVLITSADSRIRMVDGVDLVHKFKGFRNTNSQISASFTSNGRYVVCASEDSHVYIWKHEDNSRPSRSKGGVTVTHSYEDFHCQDVSAAIPWPREIFDNSWGGFQDRGNHTEAASVVNHPPTPAEVAGELTVSSPLHGIISGVNNSYFFDRFSATWPEEKLVFPAKNQSPRASDDLPNGVNVNLSKSAWGMVIVTAGLRGEIRVYQNFGLPVRI